MGKRFQARKFETITYCKKCYKETKKCKCKNGLAEERETNI